jgi:putative transposase
MKKQYSAKQKTQIVLEIFKEEKSIAQIAAEYGVHSNQFYRWYDQAQEGLAGCSRKARKRRKPCTSGRKRNCTLKSGD